MIGPSPLLVRAPEAEEEVMQIERALNELLRARIESDPERHGAAQSAPAGLRSWSPRTIPPRDSLEDRVSGLVASPVRAALRQAMRSLAVRLHQIGGDDLLREVFDRVTTNSRRASVLDSAFNGVGGWVS